MTVRERIKIALDRSGKSQGDLANALGVRQGSVSAVLSRETDFDSLKYLEATERVTGFRFEWLRTGTGPQREGDTGSDSESTYLTKKVEALESLVKTQDHTIELLRMNVERLEGIIKQQNKAGV